MTPLVVPLGDIPDGALGWAGGKAANLARLIRAGFAVPDGFCVTTAAYRAAKPRKPGTATDFGRAAASEACASSEIGGCPRFSTALGEALADAYASLGGRVAVRSSATAEDLPDASFAGQQDTYLNIEGEPAVAEAVRGCWASLYTERARAYRREAGVAEDDLAMAVVVQRMVDARCAGVLFTVDPTSGDPARMVIEAVAGLGEALVSGEVEPDRFVIAADSGTALEQHCTGASPVLDETDLASLRDVGLQVAEALGGPQDIEWAFDIEGLKVLQARPITSLRVADEIRRIVEEERERLRALSGDEVLVLSSHQTAEVVPAPTPMTAAILQRWLSHSGGHGAAHRALGYRPEDTGRSILEVVCGHAYFNLNEEARSYIAGAPYRPDVALLRQDPSAAAMAVPRLDPSGTGCSFIFLLPVVMWRLLSASRRSAAVRRGYAEELRERTFPEFLAHIGEERSVDVESLSDQELVARIGSWIEYATVVIGQHAIQPSILAGESLVAAQQVLARGRGDVEARDLVQRLVMGGQENKTTEATTRLWEVAHGRASMEGFMEEFGHRGPGELEVSSPRWREEPEMVASMADALRESESPHARIEAQREARDRVEDELFDGQRPLGVAPARLRAHLAEARRYFPFREDPKYYMAMQLELVRRGLLALAERYALGDDIFYLTPEELPLLIAGKDMLPTIRARRRRRRLALQVPLPDVIFTDALDQIGKPRAVWTGEGDLTGTGVSSGMAEGTARVILDPADGRALREGEILVAPSTDPGWTPIVARAGGLILERGGMLSHGAVVAREYGLPAVTNVADATRVLRSGQRVRIDGASGVVSVVRPEEA